MAPDFDDVQHLSVMLLVASGCLIGPSIVEIGGSPLLAVALAALSGGLFLGRSALANAGRGGRLDVGDALAILWLGPLVAAAIVLLTLPTTPGEIQTLGGLLGLIAMANYFLVPVYRLGVAFVRYLGSVIDGNRR